jgi:hypothetical protein
MRIPLIILVGLLCFSGNWLISSRQGIPVPLIHDEFSYLLAADTFAHGRMTNPTHPMWEHFETFHVLQQPSYMSRYPPGQGFFLAAGQVLGGHPIYGVWLSAALMCMAICWMLFAWVPPYWALIGGLISVIEFGVFTYWSQSYWGGSVAAMGGALVFGALPRVFKNRRLIDVIWLGLGIAVLMNSRPIEGILIGLPVGCLVLPWKMKWEKIKNFQFVLKILFPFLLILLLIVTGLGNYNKAVTGRAGLFPYVLYLKTQTAIPFYIWEPLRPMPSFRHEAISNFEKKFNISYFLRKKTWKGFVTDETDDLKRLFMFYFGFVLAVPVVFLLPKFLGNGRRTFKFILAIVILAATCAGMPYMVQMHYFSSLTGLAVLLVVFGLRSMVIVITSKAKISSILFKRTSKGLIYVLLAIQLLINMSEPLPQLPVSYGSPDPSQGPGNYHSYTREQFKNMLVQMGGKHLVIVKNDPNLIFNNEWVFNNADIDNEPIVWARSMKEKDDAKLVAYFKGRQVWQITLGKELYLLKRYDQR